MKAPDGWRIRALDEVAQIQTGLSKSSSRTGEFVRLPYLRVANVQDGHLDLSEVKEIDVPADSIDRFRVQVGDLLLTEGGDFDKLGRGAIWKGDIPNCVHQNHLFVVRANETLLDRRFLAVQTQAGHGRAYFQSCSKQSTNLASINSTQLKQFPVLLPPLSEQQKIAEILGTWDEALEKLDALIAAKERRKQALMQQLLTGKRRPPGFDKSNGESVTTHHGTFPADWSRVKLGKITAESTVRAADAVGAVVLSCTKHHGLVPSEEYFGRRVYAADTSAYKLVRRGEFAYATNHIEEGSIGLQNVCDVGLVSPIYTVFRSLDTVDDRYLFRVLKSPLLIHLYQTNTSASVDRRGSLRYNEFANIKVHLPSKPEQRAIAAVLDTADAELRFLRQQHAALDQQKRGLMQQLLTGKVRVSARARFEFSPSTAAASGVCLRGQRATA
ncbi:MAG: restriction endonuclease subunit S [Opitutaceae bacterium]|nr:restriction endonuclease subunit S [Opitutaceae bacterium]